MNWRGGSRGSRCPARLSACAWHWPPASHSCSRRPQGRPLGTSSTKCISCGKRWLDCDAALTRSYSELGTGPSCCFQLQCQLGRDGSLSRGHASWIRAVDADSTLQALPSSKRKTTRHAPEVSTAWNPLRSAGYGCATCASGRRRTAWRRREVGYARQRCRQLGSLLREAQTVG